MSNPSRLLFISKNTANTVKPIQTLFDGDVVGAEDAQSAIILLRQFEHTFTIAMIDSHSVQDELEELIVYIRSTYPETKLVLWGDVSEEDQRRFRVLGVALFISPDMDLTQAINTIQKLPNNRSIRRNDWEVVVDRNDWVEISVPSQKEYVSRIQDLLDLLERSKLPQDTRDELILALDELVTNAMEWGNQYGEGRRVKVSYYCTQDRVMLKVEDEGSGFHTDDLSDPTQNVEAHLKKRKQEGKRPGGFGIHMIKNMMDEFAYNDRGNIVLLTKFLEQIP